MSDSETFDEMFAFNESRPNANLKSLSKNESETKINNEDLLILMQVVPILVPTLFSLIIILGFFGNLLVVFVVVLNKNMRNTTNLLILNLAVSK